MRCNRYLAAMTFAVGGLVACGQPPAGNDGPPPGRGDSIRDALDANGDHVLDADEIKNAATNLTKADTNGDGRIDHEEFHPPPPPPMPRGEGGLRGPPPREGGPDGRPPRETGGESRDGGRPIQGSPGREGRPLRDGGLRGEGGPAAAGGPSPERFVERAMSFDADGDGKLDRGELETFAAEASQRMRALMAERGVGPAAERGGGFRPAGGSRRRPAEGGETGERPERPRRPE